MTARSLSSLGLVLSTLLLLSCVKGSISTREDPGVVRLDGALDRAFVRAGQANEVIARLEVTAGEVQSERNPLNLALVLDTSGSMEGEPIESLREATKSIFGMLSEGDYVSVVAFHSEAELLLEATEVDREELDELQQTIDAMQARGTTAMSAGLRAGINEVLKHRSEHSIDRIVLLGDGVPNSPQTVETTASQAGNAHIAVTALGLGHEFEPGLMGRIAQLSGGHFEYLENAERVARVFRDEVMRLEQVVARNTQLQLRPGPGVNIIGIVGQDVPAGDGGLSLNLGDLASGERRDIFVRLAVPGRSQDARIELLDANLHFQDAVVGAGALRRFHYFGARASSDVQAVEASVNAGVRAAADEAQAAAETIEAINMVRIGRMAEAQQLLQQAEARTSATSSQGRAVRRLQSSMGGPAGAPSAPDIEREMRQSHEESMDNLHY